MAADIQLLAQGLFVDVGEVLKNYIVATTKDAEAISERELELVSNTLCSLGYKLVIGEVTDVCLANKDGKKYVKITVPISLLHTQNAIPVISGEITADCFRK